MLFASWPGKAGTRNTAKDSTYPIRTHGVGRWFAIDVPLLLQHNLKIAGLTDYKVKMTVDILTRKGKPPSPLLQFAITGQFKNVIRPRLPGTSHVQLVIDGKATSEYPLKAYAFEAGGEQLTAWVQGAISLADYRAMVAARQIQGRLYWRSDDGKQITRQDVRTFKLDAKCLRSLKELDKKVRP
jgi:hypothetical protein